MIAFVQPFGLNSPGGGPRILRALLQDPPEEILSICSAPEAPPATTWAEELHVPVRLHLGRLERTRLAPGLGAVTPLLARRFRRQLTAICTERGVNAIHAIPHGLDFWYTYEVARDLGIAYYLNIHDDLAYALRHRPESRTGVASLAVAWAGAQGRMVISDEMGREYCRRYGERPYYIITDGVGAAPDGPRPRPDGRFRIYFGGAKHLSYDPNFRVLLEALRIVRTEDPALPVSLTSRGSAVDGGSDLPVVVLPWAADAEVARDLDNADLLYLPLPFDREHEGLCRFSLPTKMISYLGSGVPILYHGPDNAAAGRLLAEHRAATFCHSLDPCVLAASIRQAERVPPQVVRNALRLVELRFRLGPLRHQFWSVLRGSPSVAGSNEPGADSRLPAPERPSLASR